MKKHKIFIAVGILMILAGIIFFVRLWLRMSEGIGIIGGADAPTAIFLFSRVKGKGILMLTLCGLIFLIVGISSAIKNKKSK